MKIDLTGKKALVTGSTAGIGLAIALGLDAAGAEVYVNGRTQERVDKALALLKKNNPSSRSLGVAADCGTAQGIAQLISKIPSVDILVNNVGIFEPKPFFDIPDEDWTRFFEVNVMSGVRLSRHYTPAMQKAQWGRVLFISSESAVQIPAEMIHYGMSKTAQLAVARGLAETVGGSGVTVNSVLVGPTKSEGVGTFVNDLARQAGVSQAEIEKEFFTNMRPSSLVQRFLTPEEIANMVVFLCSQEASATTGSAIRVDGGVTRGIL
jgi:NAD(P)-dependent dehydrogenase (short-subunit alcohol dehydrogenase family)